MTSGTSNKANSSPTPVVDDRVAIEGSPRPSLFRMHGRFQNEDRTHDMPLFTTDLMWAHLKIYTEGGENDLHAHPQEEHAFIVLEGVATFLDADEVPTVVSRYEGILLPKGTYYRFQNSGADNLVMLRIGAGSNSHLPSKRDERVGPDGKPMPDNPSQIARGLQIATGAVFGGVPGDVGESPEARGPEG